jgi:tetratricopeptide (TPR) repeat protein
MRTYARFTALSAVFASLAAATPLRLAPVRPGDTPAALIAVDRYRIALGDLLTANGQFDAARRVYTNAVNLARADGRLPLEELRRIANAYYFEGAFESARATLLELAEEAASAGAIDAQVWAIADAAWLASLSGADQEFNRHLQRVERLLDTYYVPGARFKIRTRMLKNFMVFAPHLPTW